jgi:hypothetical protein
MAVIAYRSGEALGPGWNGWEMQFKYGKMREH